MPNPGGRGGAGGPISKNVVLICSVNVKKWLPGGGIFGGSVYK